MRGTRKLVKKEIKYDERNLRRVEGHGKTKESICLEYIALIESGYCLTVDQIANYLSCTYQHVLDKIIPQVKHIRITEVAKMMLFKYSIEQNIEENISSFFTKRILFDESDFKRYICENTELNVAYKRFYQEDFDSILLEEIKENLLITKDGNKPITFEKFMQRVLNSFLWKGFKNQPIIIKGIDNFPENLYSQKELIDRWGIKYKVVFYRQLEALGINKMKLGNLVRYRKEEIDEKCIATMPITAFIRLQEDYKDEYIIYIQNRALEMIKSHLNIN